jgi:hypothetical protein
MPDSNRKDRFEAVDKAYYDKYFPFEKNFITKIPSTIYHYTNISSFISIVGGKSLWASRAEFLNDATEFRYGLEICRAAAEKISELGAPYSAFVSHLRRAMERGSKSPFVTCFCRDGDLLSQWRAYSSHGQGLSIGFRSEALVKVPYAHIRNIIYDHQAQIDFFSGHIKILADIFAESGVDFDDPEAFRELVGHTGTLERSAAIMKDYAFREESETRIFISNYNVRNELIRFRPRNNLVIPYIDLNLEPLWQSTINDIVIGPGPDPETRRQNIDHFLELNKLDHIVVKTSKCQLRQ